MSDALEEVAHYHLCSNQWEYAHAETETMRGEGNDVFVSSEDERGDTRYKFSYQETNGCDQCSCKHSVVQHSPYAVILVSAPVVTSYGLHALVEAHHYHQEEEYHTIYYAVCCKSVVATIFLHTAVDEQYHQTSASIHQEGRHANGYSLAYDASFQFIYTTFEMQ